MARKTNNTKSTIRTKKTKRPRSTGRGWLVLRQRWVALFKAFGILFTQTHRFLYKSLITSLKRKKKLILKKTKKPFKRTASLVSTHKSLILILLGILFMGMWANHQWEKSSQERISREALLKSQLAEVKVLDSPHPTHIFIKWFVDAPITDGTLIGNTWTLSETEAIYLTQSARPGFGGNSIIYGHNTREMLGNIRALKGYEIITLTMSDGSERKYKVREMHQVTPEEIKYIQPTTEEVLTLFTCAGFADRDRFVVQAVPYTE